MPRDTLTSIQRSVLEAVILNPGESAAVIADTAAVHPQTVYSCFKNPLFQKELKSVTDQILLSRRPAVVKALLTQAQQPKATNSQRLYFQLIGDLTQ